MFALLADFWGKDLCVMEGMCTPAPEQVRDITSFAVHTSTHGVYSAEQVLEYRKCSNDYTSKFKSTWDGNPWSGHGIKGYSPVDGTSKIEAFRICWEPLNIQYPTAS